MSTKSGAHNEPAEQAFEAWRDGQPYGGATDRERMAFLAGFDAARNPNRPPPAVDIHAAVAAFWRKEREDKEARAAALPPGTCPDCEGEGQQGGQFCGGYWECETCSGTGKASPG